MLKLGSSLVCAGLAVVGACAADDPAEPDPIAEVALANGLTVSFYEPMPGTIEIAQRGPASVPAVREGRSAVELYASLVPDAPVPDALVAAQARLEAARAERGPAPERSPHADVGATGAHSFIDNKTIDDQWFVNNFCGATAANGYPDALVCRVNLTSEIYSSWSDTDVERLVVCADVGNISLRTTSPVGHFWDILEGDCLHYYWESGWLNDLAASHTENVGGNNRYHYSARYWD